MGGLSNYLLDKVQSKTGLSSAVIVGYALQALFGVGATVLLFVTLFFVFSDYLDFGPMATSIGMLLAFVFFVIGAMLWTSSAKKKTIAHAERALKAQSFVSTNVPLLSVGMQLGNKLGWRLTLPVLLVLFAASGVAAEWSRRRHHPDDATH